MTGRKRSAPNTKRQVLHTVLVVGEGLAEVEFLQHLKSIYIQRGCGISLRIINAYGKGAKNVVSVAVRQSSIAQYNKIAALLDADTDWSSTLQKYAEQKSIRIFVSEPCIEAFLLRICGHDIPSQTTAALKRQFKKTFGAEASNAVIYHREFTPEIFEAARSSNSLLDDLINFISDPRRK